ncbi:MAG: 6-pyruvoyl tetrahydropterin synthase family protein [Helicobacter sp.]|nr:6-pyruvoyl tetrahydropterin synthase family protein [Helicobacter sp.]
MIIRRSFKFCASHVVRNCTSTRCSQSLHGHNYKVEVFVKSDSLDFANMVLDFGILKNEVFDFIDCFDHATHFWDKEDANFIAFIKNYSKRYVSLPFNASAESYALIFFYYIDLILKASDLNNGEDIELYAIRVHETDYGYAEAARSDLERLGGTLSAKELSFSNAILDEMRHKDLFAKLERFLRDGTKQFFYKRPEHQISTN